jgi:hypothetical protein
MAPEKLLASVVLVANRVKLPHRLCREKPKTTEIQITTPANRPHLELLRKQGSQSRRYAALRALPKKVRQVRRKELPRERRSPRWIVRRRDRSSRLRNKFAYALTLSRNGVIVSRSQAMQVPTGSRRSDSFFRKPDGVKPCEVAQWLTAGLSHKADRKNDEAQSRPFDFRSLVELPFELRH